MPKEENELAVFKQLLKNASQSDRKIARNTGLTKPTVSRIRTILEQNYFTEYTVMPMLKKLGFELIALTFMGVGSFARARAFKLARHPSVLFAARGRGLNYNMLIVSIHRNYTDFVSFRSQIPIYSETFLIDTTHDIIRHLSFKDFPI